MDLTQNIQDNLVRQLNFNEKYEIPEFSVLVTVYNHAEFIQECLESVFTQQVDFPFEVLIGYDNSDDASLELCIETTKAYKIPTTIFVWKDGSQSRHLGKATGTLNVLRLYQLAKGKLFSRIDGDDKWISSQKLSIQKSLLEQGNYELTFGQSICGKTIESARAEHTNIGAFDKNALKWGNFTGATSGSIAWKDEKKNQTIGILCNLVYSSPFFDWTLQICLLRDGGLGLVTEDSFVFYRQHDAGAWSSMNRVEQRIENLMAISAHNCFYQTSINRNDAAVFLNSQLYFITSEMLSRSLKEIAVVTRIRVLLSAATRLYRLALKKTILKLIAKL